MSARLVCVNLYRTDCVSLCMCACLCVCVANVCRRRRRAEICSQFGLKLKAGASDNFEVMCVLCCQRYGMHEIFEAHID